MAVYADNEAKEGKMCGWWDADVHLMLMGKEEKIVSREWGEEMADFIDTRSKLGMAGGLHGAVTATSWNTGGQPRSWVERAIGCMQACRQAG